MAQYNFPTVVPTTDTGTTLSNYLNSWVPAINSSNSGTTAPTYNVEGMPFYNTTDKSWGVWNGTNYDMKFSGSGYFAGNLDLASGTTTGVGVKVQRATGAGSASFWSNITGPSAKEVAFSARAGADKQTLLQCELAGNKTVQIWGDGSGYFAGTVGVGIAPASNAKIYAFSTLSNTAQSAIKGVFNMATASTSKSGACVTATIGNSVTNSDDTYLFTGVTKNVSKFNIKGDGSGYFAGSVKCDGAFESALATTTLGFVATSDTRMKKDWRDGSHSLDDFDGVEHGHFKFIDNDEEEHFGVKAQTMPAECVVLTDQIVPEHEDLYYHDVEVTEEVPLEEGDDGYVAASTGDDFDNEEPVAPQTKTVKRMERQRNDVPLDDAHRVLGINMGASVAKLIAHNQMLKAQLTAFEARLAALESK